MLAMTFNDATARLWELRSEIGQAAIDTLVMMGISTTAAIIIGGLFGVFLFLTSDKQLLQNKSLYALLGGITNFMRAFPFVILMIAMSPFTKSLIGTSIGPVAASLVLALAGSFYFARLVEQNLREVPRGIVEATDSMGASPMTIIKVLLTEARSGLVLSVTILCISLLSYSAAAGMIGGGGLGDLAIRYGYYRYQTEVMIFIVIVLSLMVVGIQGIGNWLAAKLDKR
ncbi:ABC transporter permease [Psychrobacter sp. YP14]|jgi:D-methionine transport system permease protein|uniref:ABC transporter permease subunit n=3 Tax=Psychrobacter TaxID=497 RepID=A0A844M1I1_9GAMM|nr:MULTISPECIES: methionine ABC transporter permease [Psychrobacter]AWT49208.1 ABC transporter permease [Psychrobacter sp. YP14]MUG32809.1 ABC transporter permease subunit [Psychrobacter sanguinis]UNK04486.1 ABC transporter permease [Psychrobacter sp. PraFG1]